MRRSQEMCAVLPPNGTLLDQPGVGFVDERGRLQRLLAPLMAHIATRETAQLVVHQRHERFERALVAGGQLVEQRVTSSCLGSDSTWSLTGEAAWTSCSSSEPLPSTRMPNRALDSRGPWRPSHREGSRLRLHHPRGGRASRRWRDFVDRLIVQRSAWSGRILQVATDHEQSGREFVETVLALAERQRIHFSCSAQEPLRPHRLLGVEQRVSRSLGN